MQTLKIWLNYTNVLLKSKIWGIAQIVASNRYKADSPYTTAPLRGQPMQTQSLGLWDLSRELCLKQWNSPEGNYWGLLSEYSTRFITTLSSLWQRGIKRFQSANKSCLVVDSGFGISHQGWRNRCQLLSIRKRKTRGVWHFVIQKVTKSPDAHVSVGMHYLSEDRFQT